jgi:hypothetical protein
MRQVDPWISQLTGANNTNVTARTDREQPPDDVPRVTRHDQRTNAGGGIARADVPSKAHGLLDPTTRCPWQAVGTDEPP